LLKPGLLTSLRFCFAFFGLGERYEDFSPVTSLGIQFPSDSLLSDSLLDIPSGSAHCAEVRRNPLTRVFRRKPILSEQALPVLRRSPRPDPAKPSWTQKEIAMPALPQRGASLTDPKHLSEPDLSSSNSPEETNQNNKEIL